jgi:hypothetical protein
MPELNYESGDKMEDVTDEILAEQYLRSLTRNVAKLLNGIFALEKIPEASGAAATAEVVVKYSHAGLVDAILGNEVGIFSNVGLDTRGSNNDHLAQIGDLPGFKYEQLVTLTQRCCKGVYRNILKAHRVHNAIGILDQ